ncbi:MAG: TonB-dependent receptor [Bacteroidota bacterium]
MKITKAVFFSTVWWFGIQLAVAQPGCNLQISGVVVDEEDHEEKLPFAALFIREADMVTTTEDDGSFLFEGLCPGVKYHLEVHFVGHVEFHQDIILAKDTVLEIRMHGDDLVLGEVEVVGQQVEEHTLEQATRLEATVMRQTRNQALGKMLEGINGVRSLQSGPTVFKPVIHGLHSNSILIYQNDIRLEGQQWGTEHAPEIDPFQAERVAVLKGAPAVRYGAEAIGGVVVIEPPALPTEEGWAGELSLNGSTNGRMGSVAAQLERGSARIEGLGWRLQGSMKRAGDFHTPNYGLANTGVREANASGAIGLVRPSWKAELFGSFFSSRNGILRSAHIGNLTDLQAALASDTPFFQQPFTYDIQNPQQAINHSLAKLDIELPMADWGGLDIIYGFQRNARKEFDVRRGGRDSIPAMDMSLFTNTLDVHYHHPLRERWKGTMGITGMVKANRNEPGTGVVPLIPAYRLGRGSVFAMEQYIQDRWEVEAGARYDVQGQTVVRRVRGEIINSPFFFQNVSATVGGLYKFSEQMSLRSILATAWRPPDVSELYSEGLHHGAAALEQGDTTLQPEAAFKWLNTFSWTGKIARLEIDAYYQRINNYIYLNPSGETVLTIRGAFPLFEYTQTDAQFMGWDISGQVQLPYGFQWSGQYSVVRARDLSNNGFLYLIPADRTLNRLQWQAGEEGDWQWRIWAEHVWVAEQFRVATENDFALPPDGYMLLHGGVAVNKFTEGAGWEVILQVQNAANTTYRDYMNRYRYFADEMGRNITLTVNYSF